MNISFNGYRENVLTFECESTVAAGNFVKMSASGKVAKCAPSDPFIGVCLSAKDGYAAVQLDGYVETKKNGTINVGYVMLAAASNGVKFVESGGKEHLVIYSDDNTVGFIL